MTNSTDGIEAPDFFDPALECGTWIKARSVIGGPTHTHVCREPAGHRDPDHDPAQRAHQCMCGHTW